MKTFIKSGFWTTKKTGATPKGWLELTKLIEDNISSNYKPSILGSLKITDAAPTIQGMYILSDVGTYTNLGGINAPIGKLNFASFDGTTWRKVEVALQSGKSAYEVAVANGFVGTEAQWLNSLNGTNGKTIEDWSAKTFPIGSSVYYKGKIYYNPTTASASGDVPGTSSKWIVKITDANVFFRIVGNLFDKTYYVQGYYGNTGVNYQSSSTYWTSDFIAVESGKKYKRVNGELSYYVYAYDINKNPVIVDTVLNRPFWQNSFENVAIPANVAFVRVLFPPSKINIFMFGEIESDFSTYRPYGEVVLKNELIDLDYIRENINESFNSNDYHQSKIGILDYQDFGKTDYSQIIMYGQSLSMGWEAPEAITTANVAGNFMIGDKVAIRHGNNGQNVLNPLISTTATSCGENPTVAAVNAFSKLFRRFKKDVNIIATSCGEGGQSIERLSKEQNGGSTSNLYNVEFLNALNRTKATVDSLGKTVSCSAIIFMQGEYNYVGTSGQGMTPSTDATQDRATYKALLLQLKNNMQTDIMTKYGQSEKPLFFIYMVAGSYISRVDMSINMAQVEFAQENDDVFLLNPTYGVPDYGGGHLSTNGYRWYGEMIAKSLSKTFIDNERFFPVMPKNFTLTSNTLTIDFLVPNAPLVFDTWTKESIANYGFIVRKNDSAIAITNIEIKGSSVVLTTSADLSTGKIEVAYAGQGSNGSGNLRDSDTWKSMYTYYDDRISSPSKRENYTPLDKVGGSAIYGKNYPMYNWCANFYKLVRNS